MHKKKRVDEVIITAIVIALRSTSTNQGKLFPFGDRTRSEGYENCLHNAATGMPLKSFYQQKKEAMSAGNS